MRPLIFIHVTNAVACVYLTKGATIAELSDACDTASGLVTQPAEGYVMEMHIITLPDNRDYSVIGCGCVLVTTETALRYAATAESERKKGEWRAFSPFIITEANS